jgi:hypothetical protein
VGEHALRSGLYVLGGPYRVGGGTMRLELFERDRRLGEADTYNDNFSIRFTVALV